VALALPLEEAIRGHEAAPALERIAEHRLVLHRLDARVDHERRLPARARPVRHEAPPHHLDAPRSVAHDHDRRRLRRRDVEPRLPPFRLRRVTERGLEILDEAFLAGERVTATHGSATLAPVDDGAERSPSGTAPGRLAYGLWGVVAAYWKLLADVDPVELVAHRAVWGLGVFAAFAALTGKLGALRAGSARSERSA